MTKALSLCRAAVLPLLILGQISGAVAQANRPVHAAEQQAIIDTALNLLEHNYIFPDKIPQLRRAIAKKAAMDAYSKHSNLQDFLAELNRDLESGSNDRHIDVFYDPVRVKQIRAASASADGIAYAPEFIQRAKYENYMFRKAERMDGNIGYLKFNAFVDTSLSKPTLVAAMNFIANTSALIIDLRQNGGGDAATCNFLLGYFLPDSVLVSIKNSRGSIAADSVYILPDNAVKKLDIPVYLLVGKRTSSAAEAFAYSLQSFRKAIIVGDTTNGEANPGYLYPLNEEMYIMIPAFRNINAITKTNWQGMGVYPDISISSDKALLAAQAQLYKTLAGTTPVKELKTMYAWMAEGFEGELSPPNYTTRELQSFAGKYADNRIISYEEGVLYYERVGNGFGRKRLNPLSKNLFTPDGLPYFRVRFVAGEKGSIAALEGLYDDGQHERSVKLQ